MVTIDQLPKETFIPIISSLDLHDQLECALVSQRWYEIISSTILYGILVFEDANNSKLYHAMNLFERKQHLGKRVRHLEIKNRPHMDHDRVMWLPKCFPNLKHLVWKNQRGSVDRDKSRPLQKQYLTKWKQLESIEISSLKFSITTLLVAPSALANLTVLSLSFKEFPHDSLKDYFDAYTMEFINGKVKSFIQKIEIIPTLENLTLSDLAIDLNDMEELYKAVPKLHNLHLENAAVHFDDTINNFTIGGEDRKSIVNRDGVEMVQDSACNVKELSVRFHVASNSVLHKIESSKETIKKWLMYICRKYTNLNVLALRTTISIVEELPVISMFEQPIIDIIHSSTSSSTYYILELYPLTRNIIKAIDDKNGRIGEAFLQMEHKNDIEEQISIIKYSRQMNNIKGLIIGTGGHLLLDLPTFKPFLLNICCKLSNLTDLVFQANTHQRVLIDVLQNLPMLQTLQFYTFYFGSEDVSMIAIKKCRIKQLIIDGHSNERGNFERINGLWEFALQSCPLLEEFVLQGPIFIGPGSLNLNLVDHNRLKTVSVDLDGIDYYTLSRKDKPATGLKLADQDNTLGPEYVEQNSHLNIAYQGNVVFDLTTAPT